VPVFSTVTLNTNDSIQTPYSFTAVAQRADGVSATDALNALAIEPHVACQPRHGLRPLGQCDRTQHLPARAGEIEIGDEPVAGQQQPAVEPEYREKQTGQGLSGWCVSYASH